MSEPQSWLHNSASKSTALKLGAGLAIIALILAGYAYGPATADKGKKAAIPASEPSATVVIAQAPSTEIQKQIPLPEPANVPPLTAADLAPKAPAVDDDKKIQALIPLPEPANVPPPTAADFGKPATETAVAPAEPAAPAAQAEKPQPAPAVQTSVPATAPAQTPTQQDAAKPATETEPQMSAEEIRKLTGKNLVKAPIAATLSDADRPAAEALRETLAGRADRFIDRREDRAGVESFYRDRGFAPLWIENGARGQRATAAIQYLTTVGQHGLEPSDYPVPNFGNAVDAQKLAETELQFTNSVLDYARHASIGRFHYSRLTGDIFYDLDAPEPAAVLANLAGASDAGVALDSYQPQHPQYVALKAQLAAARGETQGARKEVVRVPDGPTLKPGMKDSRVAALRKRLEVTGDQTSEVYDDAVATAVMAFQKGAGLAADGLAGPATVRALNGGPAQANKADTILVNMERWRWLPRTLGNSYVTVNIADFRLSVTRNGRNVWGTKIITGRLNGRETPLLSTAMRSITVNPTWNVPQSIIAKDYLPALQQDPGVMDRMGIRIEENRDGTIRMFQPPGDNNALGRLRFNTPNQFLVYLHDTPDKKLFDRDQRTFSAGCMRVQDPTKFAEVVLGIALPKENHTQESVRRMFGNSEININFPTSLPVHITYQTAFVDDAGKLQIRSDVYGHDQRMIGLLKSSNRHVAEVAVPKPKATYNREELRMPGGTYYGSYSRDPVGDFFRSIFR